MDAGGLAVAGGTLVIVCMVFSLLSFSHGRRLDIDRSLRDRGPPTRGVGYARLSSVLVLVQVAMSTALLIASLLLVKSAYLAENTPVGFDASKLLKFRVGLRPANYRTADERTNISAYMERELARLPGVEHVAMMHANLPKVNEGNVRIRPIGNVSESGTAYATAMVVGHAFVETLGLRLMSGRTFAQTDSSNSPRVAIVSEELARFNWPGRDPVGQQMVVDTPTSTTFEVVGVVSDIRAAGPRPERLPIFYCSERQNPQTLANYILRVRDGDPRSLARAVRRVIVERDPDTAVYQFETVAEHYHATKWQSRFAVWFLSFFATFALLVAASGIYALLSYTVARRIPEFGVRIALGATPQNILSLVLRRGLFLTGAGPAGGCRRRSDRQPNSHRVSL